MGEVGRRSGMGQVGKEVEKKGCAVLVSLRIWALGGHR